MRRGKATLASVVQMRPEGIILKHHAYAARLRRKAHDAHHPRRADPRYASAPQTVRAVRQAIAQERGFCHSLTGRAKPRLSPGAMRRSMPLRIGVVAKVLPIPIASRAGSFLPGGVFGVFASIAARLRALHGF